MMAPFWVDDVHPHLNQFLVNDDPGSRQRGSDGEMREVDMARAKVRGPACICLTKPSLYH
jgi:hypothetical protein